MATKFKIDSPSIFTPPCRLAFPALDEPKNYQGKGELEYSATLLFESAEKLMEARTLAKKIATMAFGNTLPSGFWSPFRKCEEKAEKNYKGFLPGHYYVKAKAGKDVKLTLVDRRKNVLDPSVFYAGCYVIANIHFWPYQNGINTGLSVRLNGLQFYGEGERFSGRTVDFDDLGVEEGSFDYQEIGDDFL